MNTTDWIKALTPGLMAIWGIDYKKWAKEYPQVFEVETIKNRNFIEDLSITGFGYVPEKPEGSPTEYDTAYIGYTKRYTFKVFSLGFKVTLEMVEDDMYRKIRALPKALNRSVRHSIEQSAANVLNYATDTNFVGGDGSPLLATDHNLIGGGTFSNRLDPAADLNITSFQAMLELLEDFVDDRGQKVPAQAKKLIVGGVKGAWAADKILKSGQTPGTADNDYNPAQNILPGGKAIMHFLTNPNMWFIQTDIENGLKFFWRRKVNFSKDNDWEADIARYKSNYRIDVGWSDPRCVVGSPGA